MSKNLRLLGVATAALLVCGTGLVPAAYADIAITCQTGAQAGSGILLGCDSGSANSGLNNILFSDEKAITGPATTVTGITNNAHGTHATAFNFTSVTDTLLVNNANGGAATINAVNGDLINNLRYQVAPNQAAFYGSPFNAFTVLDTNLRVNAEPGTGNDPAGTVSFFISALDAQGQIEIFNTINLDLFGGENKFEFIASAGEKMTFVQFNTTGVDSVEFLDVRQNQITLTTTGGVINPQCPEPPCPVDVPEPASVVMASTSLAGMTGYLWWLGRRRQEDE